MTNKIAPVLVEMFDKDNPGWRETPDIKWNFTKFLINKKGQVVARFEPTEKIENVEEAIKEELKK